MDVPHAYLLSAPGTERSDTHVFSEQRWEQSLQTIFLSPNPESQNRWQFSEKQQWIIGTAEGEQKNSFLFPG